MGVSLITKAYMKRTLLLLTSLFLVFHGFAQTNPSAQNLPVSINFGTTAFTPPFTNMVAWTGDGTRPYMTQAAAEASGPGANCTALFSTTPASAGAPGQYGHVVSGSSRLTILLSSNTTNGTTQAALAINTIATTNVIIAYDASLSVSNARDVGIALQYRIGTTGSFTTIAGTAATYNSGTSNGGDADGPTDLDNYSVVLPAAAENQAVVQLRWITWRGSQAGNNSGIGIDNISITGGTTPCPEPTAQATDLSLTSTPTSVSGTFTNAVPAADDYIIVRSTSASLGASPADAITYSVGQTIGSGTVISVASGNAFTDNSLTPNTHYYYFVFAYNNEGCSGGPNYLTTLNPAPAGNTNDIFTQPLPSCSTPTAAPTNLVLTPSSNSVLGSFTAVADANRYLVVRSLSSTLSASPVNGTAYTGGQAFGGGVVVSYNSNNSFVANGLSTNTQYYFFVFAANSECSGEPFYNTLSLDGNATTTNIAGVPAGYYTAADGLSCQPLKSALQTIISNGYVQLSYNDVWDAYQYTDMHRNDANTADIIWDIYSDNPAGPEPYTYTFGTNQCGTYNSEADCYNREHSTPKSWFNDAYPMYSDVNHLYPTDGYVNNYRGNFPYGEVSSATFTSANGSKLGTGSNFGYNGTVFEPRNEFKGDLARTSLYMATRYENQIISNNWSTNGTANALFLSTSDQPDAAKRRLQIYDTWYIKTMFKWMNQDPVSQKETDRNNAVYYQSGQNNRNPYIDHPEYAALVWQCTGVLPVTIVDFTAQRNNESVLLRWYATFETSFRKYEVERSIDGMSYTKIGEVAGRNLATYDFTDYDLPLSNRVYYRLKMIDADGQYRYSKTVSLQLGNLFSSALVYPNPTTDKLTIKLEKALTSNGLLLITDMSGRTVLQQVISAGNTTIPVIVKQLSAGRYFIRMAAGNILVNQSFVVVK